MQTAPSLQEAILLGLFYWEDGTEFELDNESNRFLFNEAHTALLHSQMLIGWDKFAKGYIAKEWGYIQDQYYLHSKIRKKNIQEITGYNASYDHYMLIDTPSGSFVIKWYTGESTKTKKNLLEKSF